MNYDAQSRPYNGAAHRAPCDNRDLYTLQSRMTVNGCRPTLEDAREAYAREQESPNPSEYAEGFALKYLD
jgi:hypothetical protein